eukprot:13470622-Alexandrium_andersonii.AAC.1
MQSTPSCFEYGVASRYRAIGTGGGPGVPTRGCALYAGAHSPARTASCSFWCMSGSSAASLFSASCGGRIRIPCTVLLMSCLWRPATSAVPLVVAGRLLSRSVAQLFDRALCARPVRPPREDARILRGELSLEVHGNDHVA